MTISSRIDHQSTCKCFVWCSKVSFWLSCYAESLCYPAWLVLFDIYINNMKSINLSKICGPRSQIWPRLCLTFRKTIENINLPKICDSRSQTWPRFYLIFKQIIRSINLPKVYGLRNQAWPRFCLTLRKMI